MTGKAYSVEAVFVENWAYASDHHHTLYYELYWQWGCSRKDAVYSLIKWRFVSSSSEKQNITNTSVFFCCFCFVFLCTAWNRERSQGTMLAPHLPLQAETRIACIYSLPGWYVQQHKDSHSLCTHSQMFSGDFEGLWLCDKEYVRSLNCVLIRIRKMLHLNVDSDSVNFICIKSQKGLSQA